MKNENKKIVFAIGQKIFAIEYEIKFFENMKHYANLEYNRILNEIEKHPKEKELLRQITEGEKILNIKMYDHLNSLILCKNLQNNFNTEIKTRYNQIKKLESKKMSIIENSQTNNLEKKL